MKYYPDADVDFYWEFSDGWDRYCRLPPKKNWRYKDLNDVRCINHWRDLKGAQMKVVTDEDLYFDDWTSDRKRPGACLPLYYAFGARFIRLEKACPVGFKCAPLPINLAELREILEKEKLEAKLKKEREKQEKKDKKGKKKK